MEDKILRFFKTAEPDQIKPFLNSLLSQNFDSLETFTAFLETCQPKLSCNENWLSERLIASCKNCGLYENSCICIRCLLDGNHIQEKHQIFLQFGESGTCDCGQSVSWDPKGFCKRHTGQHGNPEESLPIEIKEHLNHIIYALKKFLIPEIENKSFRFFNEIFDFITSLSEMGDGVRRLVSLSFSDDDFVQIILTNSFYFPSAESESLSNFISSYANDEIFSLQFSRVVLPHCKDLIKMSLDFCHDQNNNLENAPLAGPFAILSLVFHFFHEFTIEKNIIDFNQFFGDLISIAIEFLRSNPIIFEGKSGGQFLSQFWLSKLILQFLLRKDMKDECKQFYINISSSLSQIEGFIQPITTINLFDDDTSYYDYHLCHSFTFEFSPFPFKLAKKLFYIPEIIEIFIDYLYKSDNNDHLSFLFLVHKLAISTLKNAEKPKEEFDRIISKHIKFSEFKEKIDNKEEGFENFKDVYELIYIRACLIPINVITNVMLRDLDLLNKDEYPPSLLNALNKYSYSYYSQIDLPFLLSLVQFMFSFIEDKNKLVELIESHLDIFDQKNEISKAKRLFCFYLIVSALICNDPKLIGKKKKIVQLIFMTILKTQPDIKSNYLSFFSGPTELNRAMKWYREVKFENNWHIILPYFSPETLLKKHLPNILSEIAIKSGQTKGKSKSEKTTNITKNNDYSTLLPFPDFVDNDLIDQRSMMKSTYLYAVLYDTMYETREPLLYHYALNLFILFYNNEQIKNSKELTEERKIDALNVDEIVKKIPNDNFIEFCDTKINYKRGGSYISLIDLIENLGPLGLNTLNRTLHKRNKKEIKRINKLKSNTKAIKARVISNFKKNALNFNYFTVTNKATDIKMKPDEKMFIFVDFAISTIPDFLETRCHFDFNIKDLEDDDEDEEEEEKEIFFSFMKKREHLKKSFIINSCGHFSKEPHGSQVCPHCNTMFSFYLPNFNATNDPNLYADQVYSAFNYFGSLKNCMKLLKNMIIILDFRSRLKPEVLQDEMTFLLYRNMFILTMLLIPGIDPSLFANRKSNLGNFFHDYVFTYNCEVSNFKENFVKNYVIEKDYKIDYEFLKRIELIRLFFFNTKLENIVDIDEHFSFRNLINMYKIPTESIVPTKYTKYQFYRAIYDTNDEEEDIEKNEVVFDIDEEYLPAFKGIDLPDNFLNIMNEPFNIELVSRKGIEKIICLATGEILDRNYTRTNMPIPRELTYQPVLIADGPRMNAIGIWRINYFIFYNGIYRNNKGNEDTGFADGDPVFLDHERYIDLIDDFISGKCIKRIHNEKAEVI